MYEPDLPPDRDSKSQRKRDMLALQDLGQTLVNLPASQLAKIPLEAPLADAIEVARNLKSHEAKRRQLQYIGKLMRRYDPAPIYEALDRILMKDEVSKAKFHQAERWRDKLSIEGDEIQQTFMEKYPNTNRQQLRQLVRNAKKDIKNGKDTGANTALFRFLRGVK